MFGTASLRPSNERRLFQAILNSSSGITTSFFTQTILLVLQPWCLPPRLILTYNQPLNPPDTPENISTSNKPTSQHHRLQTFTMSATTTPNLTPFEDAMNKAFEKMTPKERDELLALQTIDDVYAETDKIQEEQGQKGLLRNSNKIKPYLLWLQQFSGVIEVFVQVNPSILALIWVRTRGTSYYVTCSCTNGHLVNGVGPYQVTAPGRPLGV